MPENEQHTPSNQSPQSSAAEGIRRLAAIMFTDIKDFSKKMQHDEVVTMRMLEIHNRMMREVVGKYRGNVIKTIGDAFLVSFESVIDATSCAIEAQQRFLEYNKEKSPEEKITVRVGVHVGDVIVKDKDVFGDGVNIASRVQSMAQPGGVNITESVYQQVKNKLDIHVITLGVPQLKGIKEAVRVYQVIIVPTGKARGKLAVNLYVAGTLLRRKRSQRLIGALFVLIFVGLWIWSTFFTAPSIQSIAVLPFESQGTQEYLTDGLTEEVIFQLTKIPEILVISKASSFTFKNSPLDGRAIAKQLGVEYLLKGTVRSVADQVNVDVYLLEPTTGAKVWTEVYRLNQSELFHLRYQIPRQIADRFRLHFSAKLEKTDPEVYDLYSRGLYEQRKVIRESNLAAIGYYTAALTKDSTFLPARVALSRALLFNYYYGWDRSEHILLDGESNCQKALQLDSTNAEALAILGEIKLVKGERDQGIVLLQRALIHDSKNFFVLSSLGREYLFNLNQPGTAIGYLQRAFETDPTNFLLASNIGIGYGMLKNYPLAIEAFRRASSLNPSHDYPFRNLGIAFERNKQYDSALFYYRTAVETNLTREDNYLLWGELLTAVKQYERAESVLTAGARQAVERDRLWYDLGVVYMSEGKGNAARKTWEEALQRIRPEVEKKPPSLKHTQYAALLSARLGNQEDAVSFIQRALQMDSTDSEIFFNAARVYAILGKKKEMLVTFRKARSMNPEYDTNYLVTAIDFDNYKNDPDVTAVAR